MLVLKIGPDRDIYFGVAATLGGEEGSQTLYDQLVVLFGLISVIFILLFKNSKDLL